MPSEKDAIEFYNLGLANRAIRSGKVFLEVEQV
jgi:hypothetical protein